MLGVATMHRGMTLIEMAIGLVIVGLLLVMALPGFGSWLQNSQIRNAAESLQNGLQLARAEAVRRNTRVQFVLGSVQGGGVAADWTASCAVPIADLDADGLADCPGDGVVPTEIQRFIAAEGAANVAVAADQPAITYAGTGRVAPVPAASLNINLTNPAGGACAVDGGPMRCLRIVVSTGGQIRMCDPALASTDPRGC